MLAAFEKMRKGRLRAAGFTTENAAFSIFVMEFGAADASGTSGPHIKFGGG